jgi:hypothetical protein
VEKFGMGDINKPDETWNNMSIPEKVGIDRNPLHEKG